MLTRVGSKTPYITVPSATRKALRQINPPTPVLPLCTKRVYLCQLEEDSATAARFIGPSSAGALRHRGRRNRDSGRNRLSVKSLPRVAPGRCARSACSAACSTEAEFLVLLQGTRHSRYHWRNAAMLMLTFYHGPPRVGALQPANAKRTSICTMGRTGSRASKGSLSHRAAAAEPRSRGPSSADL